MNLYLQFVMRALDALNIKLFKIHRDINQMASIFNQALEYPAHLFARTLCAIIPIVSKGAICA